MDINEINEELEKINEDELLEVLEDISIPPDEDTNENSDFKSSDEINLAEIDLNDNNNVINDDLKTKEDSLNNDVIKESLEIKNPNCDKILDVLKELLSKKRIDITIRIRG